MSNDILESVSQRSYGVLKTRRHMTTYTQFWDIDGNIRLPRPERTYFDDGADEFKDITFEEKLLEIAYCVWHGLSLYDEIKTTLQEHTSVNESTIKRCLFMYIEYLRSGDFKNISYVILNKKLNGKTGIKQAAALLSDELMLRYRLPANGEPHYLAIAHWKYKELEGKVDYTKPTTVLAIPLTEQEILDINPWQSIYVNPNRSALYDPDAEWLLIEDEKMIKDFNEKTDKEYRFELGMRPEPFNGNPLRSKVVILSLNPGYKYRVNNLVARLLQMIQPIEEAVKQHKNLQLKLSVSSFFCKRNHNKAGGVLSYRDAHCMLDDWYWYDIFEEFRKNAELEPENDTNDIIFNHTSLVQYVGYISKSWKSLPNILPSQRFTKLLIQYLALNTDTLFVISRSESEWKELIGDEIWDMLESENRLVHRKKYDVTNKNGKQYKTTIRTQSFTKDSFAGDGFDKIAEKLKKG